MTAVERKENYQKGVVYTTSKEMLADFLRDRLALENAHQSSRRQIRIKHNPHDRSYDKMVMRGIDTAIVDKADSVLIVDEFTGRMMPQRTWRHGLHQSIEALEGLPLSDPSETLAWLSFQRFFRFFRKIGGMSGTAREAANEFWHIYELPVLSVPTNKPCIRKVLPGRFYPDQKSKWQAICDEVGACQETGQTDAVTIATNMAGRGADIKLGKGVAELGGLHVVVSERHESGRIDRQLCGRCARQGDPGSTRTYGSLEDELVLQYGPKPLLKLVSKTMSRNRPESTHLVEHLISLVQQKAQRQAFRQRKFVMLTDDWLTDALSFARSEIEK